MREEMLRDAFIFALKSHKEQKYGDQSFIVHLYDVVSVLIEFGFRSKKFLTAAWLHDAIEDTPATYQDIARIASVEVAEIVFALTDELGRNRKERKERTLPKVKANHNALIVKLADWIANLRECYRNSPRFLQMYQKEYPYFRDMCYKDNVSLMPMWNELDRLIKGK